MRPSLDIIIVNWNTGDALRHCLLSIAEIDTTSFDLCKVVVVDNASSDTSLADFENIGLPLILLRNQSNEGFARACNQGARLCSASYLLFLNPDSRLMSDSLSRPLAFLDLPENNSVGICGVQLLDSEGRPALCWGRFPSVWDFLLECIGLTKLFPGIFPPRLTSAEAIQTSPVDQVIGAFFMVRHALFRINDGFDERFFMYFEEVDFSLRAKSLGFSSYLLTGATAVHLGAGSSSNAKVQRLFYLLRSRTQYVEKHSSKLGFWAVLLLTVAIEPLTRLSWSCRADSRLRNTLSAYRAFYEWLLRTYIIGRVRVQDAALAHHRWKFFS
jgi:GT2 family glycosyltransferase